MFLGDLEEISCFCFQNGEFHVLRYRSVQPGLRPVRSGGYPITSRSAPPLCSLPGIVGLLWSVSTPGLGRLLFDPFQEMVTQNCVVIFSKSTCPFCKMAKNVFNEIGANYKVIELDEHNDGRRLQEALAHMTGARTVRALCFNAL